MREFEISIKSAPSGANVVVKGDLKRIIVGFAMLAVSVSKNTGLPLGLLAEAVTEAGAIYAIYERRTEEAVTIDMTKLRDQVGGEK